MLVLSLRVVVFAFLFSISTAHNVKATRRLPESVTLYQNGIVTTNVPVHFHLAFAGVGGMAITWETASDTSTHQCLYGLNSTTLTSSQTGSSRTYGTIYSHNVILRNLSPSTRYYYSCGDATCGMSTVKSFKTAPNPGDTSPFTLAVIGDMGIRQSNGVSASLASRNGSYDWVLDVGDIGYADDFLLYLATYEQVYALFMDEIEPISSIKAFMALPGNHEASCQEVVPILCPPRLKNFTAYQTRWRMPSQESGGVPNMWHSFDYGLIHFVQISTETDFPNAPSGPGTSLNGGPFGDQLTWLHNDLAAAVAKRNKIPWIIVSGHRPIWYSAYDSSSDTATNATHDTFLSIVEQYKVDLYLSGHEHNYERYLPITTSGSVCQNNYDNSPCPIYIVNGAAGNAEGHQAGKGSPPYLVYRDATHYGWGLLSLVNRSALTWQFITENNTIGDSITITKAV